MGLAKGSKYSPMLSDSSDYDSEEPIGYLTGKKKEERKRLVITTDKKIVKKKIKHLDREMPAQ
eukprot:12712804-Ditylum_brightwellii.AAC.1